MLFTPKKRSKAYFRTGMVILYASSIVFGILAIGAAVAPQADIHGGRLGTVAMSLMISLVSLGLGKVFSNNAAAIAPDQRQES